MKLLLVTVYLLTTLSASAKTETIDVTGNWKLTSFSLDDGNGNVLPWCEGSFGSLVYSEGYMSVAIFCRSNPKKQILYAGPYHLEGDTVVHEVETYSDPSLNQTFRRTVQMPDINHLNLIGPFGEGGKAIVSWERK